MTKIRYVLQPGHVFSKNDGQRHFISGQRLAELYGVPMRKCVFEHTPDYIKQEGDVHLWPSYSGNYKLPTKTINEDATDD